MENSNFRDFNIDESILKALSYLGYENPTKVQQMVIPYALSDRNIIVQSQTGSGKTAAFGIPVCNRMEVEEKSPQALILVPTRELAVQVREEITSIGRYKRIRSAAVFGKMPMDMQVNELRQRVHVITGTPGRTMDHIERGNIDLEKIKYFVIDEADEMLSMGFIDQVEHIINVLPKDRITMLFSATMPETIETLCKKYMVDPVRIKIDPEKLTVEKINQYCYEVDENSKFNALNRILYIENPESCMIFCKTKENVDWLADKMRGLNYSCVEIHGGMLQKDRLDIMKSFKRGEYRFLVATDVAARGIDIENVTHVINFDVPVEKESYVHRIGRTGRAGNKGTAITLVTPRESRFWEEIQQYVNISVPVKHVPTKEEAERAKPGFIMKNKEKREVRQEKSAAVNKGITKIYIGAGRDKKIRPGDIVGAITSIDGVTGEDIGIIDVQEKHSYVEIMEGKGHIVLDALKDTKIKGKSVKIEKAAR